MSCFDQKYCIDTFQALLNIDSTTGQFREIQKALKRIHLFSSVAKQGTARPFPDNYGFLLSQ